MLYQNKTHNFCNYSKGSSCNISMYVNHFSINQGQTTDDIKDLFTYTQKVIFENKNISEFPKTKYIFQK